MKRLVILCDGTWSRSDSLTPTNVVRLAQALDGTDAAGIAQVPIYIHGVGTGQGVTRTARFLDRMLGGAFGWGLMENVVDAYRHLVFMYEPGDEIFIFGFSRGAFTARSLTGFIRSTGIVGRDDLSLIPRAVERYTTRNAADLNPQTDESAEFRSQTMRSCVATSERERIWRAENGAPGVPLLRIAYLGVWDSVGALGVPRSVPILGSLTAKRYEFHDAALSSMVRSARHAIALDERRAAFAPTRWTNVAALNDRADPGALHPYQESFFAGDHGSVGGGGNVTDLASIALRWIAEGAAAAGLAFDASRLERLRAEEDPLGPLVSSTLRQGGLGGWLARYRLTDRVGPASLEDLHPSVLTRWSAKAMTAGAPPYRPGSLGTIEAQLAGHRTLLGGEVRPSGSDVSRKGRWSVDAPAN